MKTTWLIAIISLFIISCNKKGKDGADGGGNEDSTWTVTSLMDISGRYAGILPCADCSGIRTEILINPDSTFHRRETKLGTTSADSVKQFFGKVSPFNSYSKLMLKNKGDNSEFWVKPYEGKIVVISADEQPLSKDGNNELLMTSRLVQNYSEYKVAYKLGTVNPDKTLVYSRNPRGDIAIDKAWLDQAKPEEKSAVAWYANLFDTGCRGTKCALTDALSIPAVGQPVHLQMISASFNPDSLQVVSGLAADRKLELDNLFYSRAKDRMVFNYILADGKAQVLNGTDIFVLEGGKWKLKNHRQNEMSGAEVSPATSQRETDRRN